MDLAPHLPRMQSAARIHGARLARTLGLPRHERQDLAQDILVEMLGRVGRFDTERGAASTFIDLLARHGAARVRERALARLTSEHNLAADAALQAADPGVLGVVMPRFDRDLALRRAILSLPTPMRELCRLFLTLPPHAVCRAAGISRPTLYRRLHELRLRLLCAGIEPAA